VKKLIVVAVSVALGVTAIPALAATKRVEVDDNEFSPKVIRAKKGDKIRFTWVGDAPHNVKGAGINISPRRDGVRTVTVRRGGRFVCTIHPGMAGRIRLR
jgi:plastocyanin